MKIPKEISELLDKRCELASELVIVNNKLDDFLAKHNADFDCPGLMHSTHLGYTIFENPEEAKKNIINYLEDEL